MTYFDIAQVILANLAELKSIPGRGPNAMVFDAAGDIFAASLVNQNVTEYGPEETLLPTISAGVNGPLAIVVDGADNVYVANANKTVTNLCPAVYGVPNDRVERYRHALGGRGGQWR